MFEHSFPSKLLNAKKQHHYNHNEQISGIKTQLDILLVLSRTDNIFKSQYIQTKRQYNNLLKNVRCEEYSQKISTVCVIAIDCYVIFVKFWECRKLFQLV